MTVRIEPISVERIEDFRATLDAVARERKYLAMVEAPPIAAVREWVLESLEQGMIQFLAIDGRKVVGWCDITPKRRFAFQHVGVLGMGVVSGHRRHGIGSMLVQHALDAARKRGLERVELEVFASNRDAIAFYERHGFVHEGRKRRARKLDGEYDDSLMMALILTDQQPDE
jgi:ribosomal protein S18 acetylase RimI-like enzyme